jgi:hypothetical protein
MPVSLSQGAPGVKQHVIRRPFKIFEEGRKNFNYGWTRMNMDQIMKNPLPSVLIRVHLSAKAALVTADPWLKNFPS